MATKKARKKILETYVEWVADEQRRPMSIRAFAKELEMEEKAFRAQFNSFEQIESAIYVHFFEKTLALIKKEAPETEAELILSFYYTFFEHLSANRSCVEAIVHQDQPKFRHMKQLRDLKHHFSEFIEENDIYQNISLPEVIEKYREKGTREAAWSQFMFIFAFWIKDDSPGFEKTDLLIEKSVHVGMEVTNSSLMDSVLDLGKFLFKEAMPAR